VAPARECPPYPRIDPRIAKSQKPSRAQDVFSSCVDLGKNYRGNPNIILELQKAGGLIRERELVHVRHPPASGHSASPPPGQTLLGRVLFEVAGSVTEIWPDIPGLHGRIQRQDRRCSPRDA
jgi:hypothetical protein